MIHNEYHGSNMDTDEIILLLDKCDAEDCIDTQSNFQIREYYVPKSHSHNPDTPTPMEALLGENAEKYFKAINDEIQNLMRRDTWEIYLRKSIADHNVLPGTWSLKC